MPAPQLYACYDDAVEALLAEVDACGEGDEVVLNVYLLEGGDSSQGVLSGLRAAAERGARVTVSVDATPASLLSRVWERTTTLLPEALRIAEELEGFTAVRRKVPDHSKYALFVGPDRPSVALWGGVNLGDRFRPWRDFMVRLEGPAADALRRKVAGEDGAAPYPPPADAITFVANLPHREVFEVRRIYEALAEDPGVRRLRVAMAYLDRTGAQILRAALERGAEVELLLPRQANVYQHANTRALRTLLGAPGLRAWRLPHMLHAKALVAYREGGERLAFLGSANLKRNSFRMFQEVNALVTVTPLVSALDEAFDGLFAEAEEVEEPPPYSRTLAAIEERLG